MQAQCATGAALGFCPEVAAAVAAVPVEAGSTEPELPATEVAVADAAPQPAELVLPDTRDNALKSAGGLIAGTFDALVIEDMGSDDAAPSETEVTAVAEAESVVAEADGASEITASPPLALAKRTVTSVPVGSDGQPDWSVARRAEPEETSAAAVAARDVATNAGPQDVEPLAFAAPPETAPRPLPRPETVASVPESEASNDRVTVESAVNVRAGPSGSHTRLFVLPKGVDVRATHAQGGWVRIVDGENREGWVYSDYLERFDIASLPAPEAGDIQVAAATEAPSSPSGDVRTVKGQGVNVRSGPSSSNGKLFALRGGTKVTVTEENRGWLKVTDPEGRTGWAYEDYLTGG
jgi:uncharacterized protein YraI